MAVSYVSSAFSSGGGSPTVTRPTYAAGDLMIYSLADYEPTTLSPPTGSWTLLANYTRTGGTGNYLQMSAWGKICGASEPSSYSGSSSVSTWPEAGALCLRGVDSSTFLDAAPITANGRGAARSVASLTTATDGAMLALWSHGYSGWIEPVPIPSGMSLRYGERGIFLLTEPRATAGASGTRNHESWDDAWITIMIALRPATAAAAGYMTLNTGYWG